MTTSAARRAGGPGGTTSAPSGPHEATLPVRGRPRRWLVGLGLLLGVLALGTWLWLGLRPSIGLGPMSQVSPAVLDDQEAAALAGYPVETEHGREEAVIDPAPGEAWVLNTYVNDGPVPVIVDVPAPTLVSTSELLAYDVAHNELSEPLESVTVAPGDGFALRTTVDWSPCTDWVARDGMGPGPSTSLTVSRLGLSRTVAVPMRVSLMIVTSEDLSVPCG